jgi:hypothetical protein
VQSWLAPEHKTGETKGVISQVAGLVSLLLALVLGSWVHIAILVFWTASLFFGIGLYAESNTLVISALAFGGCRLHSRSSSSSNSASPTPAVQGDARRAGADNRVLDK